MRSINQNNGIGGLCDQIGRFFGLWASFYLAFGNNYFAQISHILRQFL